MNDERDLECPHCDSPVPAEWDPTTQTYHCSCCGCSWRKRQRGRLVPPPGERSLLPLDPNISEWPEERPRRRPRGQ